MWFMTLTALGLENLKMLILAVFWNIQTSINPLNQIPSFAIRFSFSPHPLTALQRATQKQIEEKSNPD